MTGTTSRAIWSVERRRLLGPCERRRYYQTGLARAGIGENPAPEAAWARVLATARPLAEEAEDVVRGIAVADLADRRRGLPGEPDPEEALAELRRRWTRVRARWTPDDAVPGPPRPGRPPILELLDASSAADGAALRAAAHEAPRAVEAWRTSAWRERLIDAADHELLWVGGPAAPADPSTFLELDGVVVDERPLFALLGAAGGVETLDLRTAPAAAGEDRLRAGAHLLWAAHLPGGVTELAASHVARLPEGPDTHLEAGSVDLGAVSRVVLGEAHDLVSRRDESGLPDDVARERFARLDDPETCPACRFRRLCPGAPAG